LHRKIDMATMKDHLKSIEFILCSISHNSRWENQKECKNPLLNLLLWILYLYSYYTLGWMSTHIIHCVSNPLSNICFEFTYSMTHACLRLQHQILVQLQHLFSNLLVDYLAPDILQPSFLIISPCDRHIHWAFIPESLRNFRFVSQSWYPFHTHSPPRFW